MNAESLPWIADPERRKAFLEQYWYYAMELAPGVVTPGQRFPNVALTRDLLSRVELDGTRCLDIGTMEGLVPVLLKRRGATDVVSIDGLDFSDKVACVKAAYGADFAYLPNIMSGSILRALDDRYAGEVTRFRYAGGRKPQRGFDVVVCSGVLYHVFSPFHVLATARSTLRPGGLMIIETAALPLDAYMMQYNFAGTGYVLGPSDTWFPTVPLLDHFLRFLKLMPLDACWLRAGDHLVRFACIARAVEHRPTLPQETLMEQAAWNLEYDTLLRSDFVQEAPTMPVTYVPADPRPVYRPGLGTCDLHATMRTRLPLEPALDRIELRLDHRT
ncbi:MAG: methyltransferase domain-containing protein [Alphaproteobacteria bacterium]|nr:methyltransferase domain-containing protein [Alphaproteobacteria bacterium]